MTWQPMETAPRDGTDIILLTADFGAVQGYWSDKVANFYNSQKDWASYDPTNAQGDWVSWWMEGDDKRLYCGATPKAWMPLPPAYEDDA